MLRFLLRLLLVFRLVVLRLVVLRLQAFCFVVLRLPPSIGSLIGVSTIRDCLDIIWLIGSRFKNGSVCSVPHDIIFIDQQYYLYIENGTWTNDVITCDRDRIDLLCCDGGWAGTEGECCGESKYSDVGSDRYLYDFIWPWASDANASWSVNKNWNIHQIY